MHRITKAVLAVAVAIAVLVGAGCADEAAGDRKLAEPSLDAFSRIESDLDVGVNFVDFGGRLQDANYAVESFTPTTATGESAKSELEQAVKYYVASREAWNWDNQGAWPADAETAEHWADDYPEVVEEYSEITAAYPEIASGELIDYSEARPPRASAQKVRAVAWAVAQRHVNAAMELLEE